MNDTIRRMIERFPEYKDVIVELDEPGSNFNALCQAFEDVEAKLRAQESSPEADAEQETLRLRRRRADLEQELLAMMQQTQRV